MFFFLFPNYLCFVLLLHYNFVNATINSCITYKLIFSCSTQCVTKTLTKVMVTG